MADHPYRDQRVVVATQHGKERALGPPFQRHLGMRVFATEGLDTDELGTFTGEISRPGSARDVAITKSRLAASCTGERFGLGSEGSFGPHPAVPFVAVDHEILALHDRERDSIIVEQITVTRTNFSHIDLGVWDPEASDLEDFCARVGFPAHALIVSQIRDDGVVPLAKGLRRRADLDHILRSGPSGSSGGKVRICTDMRAHMNPTRMAVIRALGTRLARRLARLCPQCRTPGFGETSYEYGVPCSWCGEPVALRRARRICCLACTYSETEPLRTAPAVADPRYCEICNP